MKNFDVLVLGAGIAGICTALHLQKLGRAVALIDRRDPAEETSYGNAGLIQREGVVPYSFPRDLGKIVNYAFNRLPEAHVHWRSIPWILPFVYRYWRHNTPERIAATARAMLPLIERSVIEHEALMQQAGISGALRRNGFVRVFRDPKKLEAASADEAEAARRYGVAYRLLDSGALAAREPALAGGFAGAILYPEAVSVPAAGATGKAYAKLFLDLGGTILKSTVDALETTPGGFQVAGASAKDVVVALGPWGGAFVRRFSFALPLGVKRGYHMRYGLSNDARLNGPIVDADNGFCLTPEDAATRLTTGAEFTRMGAAPTPVQLARVEPVASRMFPLGPRLLDTPWMGARPCLPDLIPAIGPVPGVPGLWLNTGHAHLGFTLGPVSGRLLAQMMTGERGFTDPRPYAPARFV